MKQNREYRNAEEFNANQEMIVDGYATLFNKPYELYEFDGVKYFEVIDRNAFKNCDMSDVIFQYDHDGRVFARTSNNTLNVSVDDVGLKVVADLSKSPVGREVYEEIKNGLTTKMSFGFRVKKDIYDKDTKTRTILEISKLYDVSAVSIPANDFTSITARNFFDGVIEKELLERKEKREKDILKIKTLIELERIKNEY